MNQQPDKLFRDKLQGHQTPAPASAWEKISAAQQKKKHHKGWLKIAASLLLIAGTAYLFRPSTSQPVNDHKLIAEQITSDNAEVTPEIDSAAHSDTADQSTALPKIVEAPPAPKQKKVFATTRQHPVSLADAHVSAQPQDKADDIIETHPVFDDHSVAVTDVESVVNENGNESITLSYSSEESSKYLNKKELIEATSESRKPSTLKKLLQKASDLKNNQDPLGDLRQMKNEILALNFKSEKQRGQNKSTHYEN
jgi:hypothetical protein